MLSSVQCPVELRETTLTSPHLPYRVRTPSLVSKQSTKLAGSHLEDPLLYHAMCITLQWEMGLVPPGPPAPGILLEISPHVLAHSLARLVPLFIPHSSNRTSLQTLDITDSHAYFDLILNILSPVDSLRGSFPLATIAENFNY